MKKKKTRILLIAPSLLGYKNTGVDTQVPPLGLAYLASMTENKGFETRILDALILGINQKRWLNNEKFQVGLSDSEVKKYLKEYKPGLVGISCAFTTYAEDSFRTARLVKETLPNAVTVFGGAHTSAMPETVVKDKNVDIAVVGEGELSFLEIAERIESKKRIDNVKGTVVKKGKMIIRNAPREFIENINELPFPARHLLPMQLYKEHEHRHYPFAKKSPVTEIVSSRGCPGNCLFCSIKNVWGRKWRARSPENIVAEIESLNKKFGIKEFNFIDDNISANPQRLEKFCDLLIRKKLDITWETSNGIAIWTLDEKLLKKMRDSGYYRAKFGIESGSIETLKYIRKPVNLERASRIIEICNKLGIWSASTFVIGFPDETREEIEKTINFAKNSGLDYARFFIAQPYGGTELNAEFKKHSLMERELHGSSTFKTKYNTLHLNSEELNELRSRAESDFIKKTMQRYLHPKGFFKYLYPKINSPSKLNYFAKSLKNLLEIRARGRI